MRIQSPKIRFLKKKMDTFGMQNDNETRRQNSDLLVHSGVCHSSQGWETQQLAAEILTQISQLGGGDQRTCASQRVHDQENGIGSGRDT